MAVRWRGGRTSVDYAIRALQRPISHHRDPLRRVIHTHFHMKRRNPCSRALSLEIRPLIVESGPLIAGSRTLYAGSRTLTGQSSALFST